MRWVDVWWVACWRTTEVLWVALAAVLLGLFLAGRGKDAQNRPVARLMGLVLQPLLYWGDFYGGDGRPSHSKVVAFFGLVGGWWVALVAVNADLAQDGDLSFGTVIVLVVVLAFSYGRTTYNALIGKVLGLEKLKEYIQLRRSGQFKRPTPPGMQPEPETRAPTPPGMPSVEQEGDDA